MGLSKVYRIYSIALDWLNLLKIILDFIDDHWDYVLRTYNCAPFGFAFIQICRLELDIIGIELEINFAFHIQFFFVIFS